MELTGLHLLLTYQCTQECDHCFVWGSPWQSGVMHLQDIRLYLEQARETESINWIFFEGGEPFLYYPLLVKGVQMAAEMGFQVGVVTNTFWATGPDEAFEYLTPFAGLVQNLSISSDLFHTSDASFPLTGHARQAAELLGIQVGAISIAQPESYSKGQAEHGMLPTGDLDVMYRGRAVEKLANLAPHKPWRNFSTCPHEDLLDPGRVHLDPLGYVHVCQGITIGNLLKTSLKDLCSNYNPKADPVIGALLEGGPARLVEQHGLDHQETYADACHLCYETRRALRSRYPEILQPDQMYGLNL